MSRASLTDVDGVDGPFERRMREAERADRLYRQKYNSYPSIGPGDPTFDGKPCVTCGQVKCERRLSSGKFVRVCYGCGAREVQP